ncbi:MAG: hypothetical protein WKG32_17400 [Gemmatimonadaceae bacterium]
MDPDAPFIIAMVAIMSGTVISLTRMVLNRGGKSGVRPKELVGIDERLSRMEQAIDAIALETERISEGQRFTTKLLADRPRETGVPGVPGADAPGQGYR